MFSLRRLFAPAQPQPLEQRYETALRAKLILAKRNVPCVTFDIAESGVYLRVDPRGLAVDQHGTLELVGRDGSVVRLFARVAELWPSGDAARPAGAVVTFVDASEQTRSAMTALIASSRLFRRLVLALPLTVHYRDKTFAVQTHDLSGGGCYCVGISEPIGLGESVQLHLSVDDGTPLTLTAEVMWRRDTPGQGKPAGLALRFIEAGAENVERIRRRLAVADKEGASEAA